MKIRSLFSISLIFLCAFAFVSCGDDDENGGADPDPLVGTFVISSAVLADDLLDPVSQAVILDAGTNITNALFAAFLLEANCNDLANARIELKADGQIFYTCLNEGTSFANGTWSINADRTQLSLVINIQGNPVPLDLTNFNEANLSGLVINLPLTPEILLAIDPTLMDLNSPFYLSNVNMQLGKD